MQAPLKVALLTAGIGDGRDTFGLKDFFAIGPGTHRTIQFHGLVHVVIQLGWSGERIFLMGAVIGDGVLIGLAPFCETTGDADSFALSGIAIGRGIGRTLLRRTGGTGLRLLRLAAGLPLGIASDTYAQEEDSECGK